MNALEIVSMSMRAIVGNRLRSTLTLVGIVAGVASIIAVMTAISVVQTTMEADMSVLGSQVFQVQKWPAGFSSDAERRAAMHWPPVTVENADQIRQEVQSVDLVGAELRSFGYVAEYRDKSTNPNVPICGGTPEYPPNNTHYVGLGRNISQMDLRSARNVAVIGHAVAQRLFPFVDPIDKDFRLDGRKYRVVGVFDEKKSAFGSGFDNNVLVPITNFRKTYCMTEPNGFSRSVNITCRARAPELVDDAIA